MVAPHDTGEFVRSLVRVRGSGKDRTLPGKFCDLSRVSTLAAEEQVNTTLPRELAQPQAPAENSANDEVSKRSSGKNKKSRLNLIQHSPRRDTNAQQQPAQPQRNQNEQGSNQPTLFVTGIRLLTPMNCILQTQHCQVTSLQPGIKTVHTLPKILEELETLKSENVQLKKRLALFQQLFRDKERLASVVQRIRNNMV